jgi:DNA-binding NarL/FixJ family response regulator
VLLLDLSLPGISGLDVAREMQIGFPKLVVVLMSEQEPSVLRRLADHFEFRYTLPKSRLTAALSPMLASTKKELRMH